jgi:Domain of unknown function (DUF4157)
MRQHVNQVKKEESASSRQNVSPTHQKKKPQNEAALLLQLQRTHGNRYVRQHLIPVSARLSPQGKPLDPATRSLMETHFGHDFKQVRIHTDLQAASSAQALKVRAYTTNQNIVFGAGQYQPATDAGQRLIAHELAHTIQQSQGHATSEFSDAKYHQAEAEADRVSRRLDSNQGIYSPTLFIPHPAIISVAMPSGLIQAEEEGGRPWYERTGAWLLGAVGGEFIDEQDFGQIGVDFVLSVIPIVDQVADARDLTAHLYRLGYKGEHNRWERWISLAFTLIGLVPEIGSVIKSLSKAAMRGLKTVLTHIGDLLVLARKLTRVDIPDVSRLRQYVLSHWSNFVKVGMDAWDLLLSKGAELAERMPRLVGSFRQSAIDRLANLRRISPQWLTRAFDRLRQVIDEALEQLRRHFGEPQLVGAGAGGANIPVVPQPKRAEILQMSGAGSKQSRFTSEKTPVVSSERQGFGSSSISSVRRPSLPRGKFVSRLGVRKFSEPLKGVAAKRQQQILQLARQDPSKAGIEYQKLIAEDLRAAEVQEKFSRPGRRMDIGTEHEVTIEGWKGVFGTHKLNQFWLDMRDKGTVLLTIPKISDKAKDQLERLGAQAEEIFNKSILIVIRETL